MIGVSGMSLYVPALCVDLSKWCEWTGESWSKIESVVGRSFRMLDRHESIYTMAANSVLRLVLAYDIDPRRIGFLGFGTESSTDNSAGAIIIKGMVDRALDGMGRPRLSRNCEVPEFKHACLGGVYALKAALRWLALDGRGRQAIVVCGDRAEYERGTSGEPTQGAGAVAQLLEENPRLFSIDFLRAGSASDYRGADFRKPTSRYFMEGYAQTVAGPHDFPVFSGKYSTNCYIDQCIHAVDDMLRKIRAEPRTFYHEVAGAFFHRPYNRMPVNAMASLYLWGLSRLEDHLPELESICREAGAVYGRVLAEMRSSPDMFQGVLAGQTDGEVYPESMKVVKYFRTTPKFEEVVASKMTLGADLMMDLGNLYTASLPAWIAAGFEEALEKGNELAGKEFVTIGYGSGDASEAMPIRMVDGWRAAAARIGFKKALERRIDLAREQYEALHDRRELPGLEYDRSGLFVVERIGQEHSRDFQDVGVEYYRYVP
ncbi:MAG: hydroxymethylglutaryl-CoA synthase family protein [Planctomycetes bacterium]|nr:hydroxymethylglutaryl-CoA synthase family protein [Planctomycetota bacterium]